MGTPDDNYKLSLIVDKMKSWIPRRAEPASVSKDFWMPDQSCRVCYECDSQFTIFNRKHHCRLCGRVFCSKCTENSVPIGPDESNTGREDSEKIRVCNYCFKQREQQTAPVEDGMGTSGLGLDLSPSPSAASLASTRTCESSTSSLGSTQYSTGSYKHVANVSSMSPRLSDEVGTVSFKQDEGTCADKSDSIVQGVISPNQFGYYLSRSDDEDDEYGIYRLHSEIEHSDVYYGDTYNNMSHVYGSNIEYSVGETIDTNHADSLLSPDSFNMLSPDGTKKIEEEDKQNGSNGCEDMDGALSEPLDFENNGLLWLPPEPEDEEDEKEAVLFEDDDDDVAEDSSGDWGYLRSSSSFGSGEYGSRDRSSELHKKAMRNVVDGHFRALIAQLLQVENLPVGKEGNKESWLEIITSLSWEAATHLKPDTSQGGGMDPGGYVKVKCIACGSRSESMVVKGVVCKKNVAHRRMTSKVKKPRFLILGGALEYQRVANHLSSVDTLLQQEMDHLKMAVAKIDAQKPNVLLVEKSVSRYAQDYLLARGISLVLNIKRPLLERIARCTGAQIAQSIDHLTSQRLGYCDSFHVEKFLEEHGSAGQGGKKLTKTLMFFEGCPKPFGCTILLKGANGDELKKVKYVVQYGVFAAYHLAVETSFLADEGASLPELPLKSPIAVALPDKPPSIDRSISMIPGFIDQASPKLQGNHTPSGPYQSNSSLLSDATSSSSIALSNLDGSRPCSPKVPSSTNNFSDFHRAKPTLNNASEDKKVEDNLVCNGFGKSEAESLGNLGFSSAERDGENRYEEAAESFKEEFPPPPSDNQSILVSLSTRCVWKGIVCERAHLFRIKYYGSFDKPLGWFLRDQLFNDSYRCCSCQMPSEAHVHCYTHREGSLTISVKKFPEFLLAGEQEGKIWMWHRCLRCPRLNGFPPATRRVVMSQAACGLSFGKFLELSFSNHAAASRVASCGHSLHRDCLRFYGFGRMVACFRYASIDVNSVHLPPSKLEFNYLNQEWLSKEVEEVRGRADVLFADVYNALHQIFDKVVSLESASTASESRVQIEEMEGRLQEKKAEFEESLQQLLNNNARVGQPPINIFEINSLRRQLLFHAYVWDQRLISFASSHNSHREDICISIPKQKEKPTTRDLSSSDSSLQTAKSDTPFNQIGNSGQINLPCGATKGNEVDQDLNRCMETEKYQSSSPNMLPRTNVRRVLSEGQFPIESLSDTLDAAWSGESYLTSMSPKEQDRTHLINSVNADSSTVTGTITTKSGGKVEQVGPKTANTVEKSMSWVGIPFSKIYESFQKDSSIYTQKLRTLCEYNPVYVMSFSELVRRGGARLLLPMGIDEIVVPVYDDEPTSIISYALVSPDYHIQVPDEPEKLKDGIESSLTLPIVDSANLFSLNTLDESTSESLRSLGSTDESILSMLGSQTSSGLDSVNNLHVKVNFTDEGPLGKVKYTVTCYCAKRFKALRKICCPSELDFVQSLSRCKRWGAQGGKSNVFFAKTLDDRFIIKQVTKTELESFLKFAPEYFKYLSESISSGSPTCLAKILGIYQVVMKHLKGGKETRMDVLVMENLLFGRNITRLYDLKGSSRSRYNPDSSGTNKVLLDQNLIEAMPTSPIFVGNKAKRLLERAVWNDAAFLDSIHVMDYSLLVGIDEENHELVLGIIDFMRQFTWDKHLESWVKTTGILGGPRNTSPTVISPKQYKKRFRKAMTAYFLMVPDQWSPETIVTSGSQSDLREEKAQGVTPLGQQSKQIPI